ncbi:MAG TPA: ribonuclease III [Verrucomicrobiae bacterium]|nr:ribonuclease III [Verrucomicrobiae bacterium]
MASVSEHAFLQTRLGYTFRDSALLRLALTHPSVAHEAGIAIQHNQRLEFLGDAVLQLVLTREIYDKFPDYNEGPLTKGRARLVNRRALAFHGRVLGLGEELILSRGEEANGGRTRPSTLADAFEAVLGAIFLDGGYDSAREFVLREFHKPISHLTISSDFDNPKGELQEMLQSRAAGSPQYQIISTTGPDHDREFECVVQHNGQELARGRGKSKKEAETEAAFAALQILKLQATKTA